MNRLVGKKLPANQLLHRKDVLEDVGAPSGTGPWMVRHPDHQISGMVLGSPSPPVAVESHPLIAAVDLRP
jgi:hypothetical protein